MKTFCIPHKYFAAVVAAIYIAYSQGVHAYACAALIAAAYTVSILCGHEALNRTERAGACGLLLAALIALVVALGGAGGDVPPPGVVHEVWV